MSERGWEKMKFRIPDKYSTTAILLLAAAAILVWIAVNTNLGEYTTAVFVLSGMVCVITGVFTLTFAGGEPVDPHLLGFLPAQGSINLCHIADYLGMKGNAYFLPPRITGESRVMQFNPVSAYDGSKVVPKGSFRNTEPYGLVTPPSCDPLIQDLKKNNEPVFPHDETGLTLLLRETLEDVFKFAPRISVRWNDSTATVTFHKYPSIDGCKLIAQESPNCCTKNPCPVCSLCGVLIAEGLEKVVTLDKCSFSPPSRDVTAVFSILH